MEPGSDTSPIVQSETFGGIQACHPDCIDTGCPAYPQVFVQMALFEARFRLTVITAQKAPAAVGRRKGRKQIRKIGTVTVYRFSYTIGYQKLVQYGLVDGGLCEIWKILENL